jgi:hypothetical protein
MVLWKTREERHGDVSHRRVKVEYPSARLWTALRCSGVRTRNNTTGHCFFCLLLHAIVQQLMLNWSCTRVGHDRQTSLCVRLRYNLVEAIMSARLQQVIHCWPVMRPHLILPTPHVVGDLTLRTQHTTYKRACRQLLCRSIVAPLMHIPPAPRAHSAT